MKNELTNNAISALDGHTTAATVSGGTIFSGIATVLEMIPAALGVVATVTGIILAVVQIRKIRVERQILTEQLRILRDKE